jgi:hypothetical protein
MVGLIINLIRFIISAILKVYQPKWLLRFDKWCEDKIGIDLIKQEEKWFEKHPLLLKRIQLLEQDTHPPVAQGGATELKDLIQSLENRVVKIEKKIK